MAMIVPRLELTLFATVLGSFAAATFGKLFWGLFPFSALKTRALTDSAFGIVSAARVSHNHTSPVLDFLGKLAGGEEFYNSKDVISRALKVWVNVLLAFKVVVVVVKMGFGFKHFVVVVVSVDVSSVSRFVLVVLTRAAAGIFVNIHFVKGGFLCGRLDFNVLFGKDVFVGDGHCGDKMGVL